MKDMQKSAKPVLGVLLFLSIIANIFLGGMVVGEKFYGGQKPRMQLSAVIDALQVLSPDSREKAAGIVKQEWPVIQAQIKVTQAKRDAVKKILVQKEYKQEDLDKAIAEWRIEINKLLDDGQALGHGVFTSITPEERQQLIRKLPNPPVE